MQAQYDEPATPSVRVYNAPERLLEDSLNLEAPFSEHKTTTGLPFAAAYLGVEKVYENLDTGLKEHMDQIDGYIRATIESRHLANSLSAAESVLKQLEAKLKLTAEHDPYYKTERLGKYVAALMEYDAEQERYQIIRQEKPPTKSAATRVRDHKSALLESSLKKTQEAQLKAEVKAAQLKQNLEAKEANLKLAQQLAEERMAAQERAKIEQMKLLKTDLRSAQQARQKAESKLIEMESTLAYKESTIQELQRQNEEKAARVKQERQSLLKMLRGA